MEKRNEKRVILPEDKLNEVRQLFREKTYSKGVLKAIEFAKHNVGRAERTDEFISDYIGTKVMYRIESMIKPLDKEYDDINAAISVLKKSMTEEKNTILDFIQTEDIEI